MNILIIQNTASLSELYDSDHIVRIQRQAPGIRVHVVDPTREALDTLLSTAHIIFTGRYEYKKYIDLRKAKSLQWVHITSTGVEDVACALRPTNILLTNSSGASAIPIAEHVFAYMLMFSRRLYAYYRIQIEEKRWMTHGGALMPSELYKKTIGIVGFGRIGRRIAQCAKQFDMRVVALEHNRKIHVTCIDHVVPRSELNILLQLSDFVVNCLPLTPETKRFFSFQQFARMKESAFFINVGRGKTVDQDDLVRVLKEKRLAGAGLDVFEEEPLPPSSELWNMPSVIITPHCAGYTSEYTNRAVDIFCTNLHAYADNRTMPNLVDKNLGY